MAAVLAAERTSQRRFSFIAPVCGVSLPLPLMVVYTMGKADSVRRRCVWVRDRTRTSGSSRRDGQTDFAGRAGLERAGQELRGFPSSNSTSRSGTRGSRPAASILGLPADGTGCSMDPFGTRSMRNVQVYRWSNEMGRYRRATVHRAVSQDRQSDLSMNDYVGV